VLTVKAYRAAVTEAKFTDAAARVLHTFGLADLEMAGKADWRRASAASR
jgi:hypothetical protein